MATPTYQDLATMVNTAAFSDRCSIAVAFFANYILNEDPATSQHQRRYQWAVGAIQNPRGAASGILSAVALDSIFTSQNPLNLATTPDSGAGSVQAAVEATLNGTILKF